MKITIFVVLALSSFVVSAAEQSTTITSTAQTKVAGEARYHEVRLRLRPDESTLRNMRKVFAKTGKVFAEERPDGGVNLIVLK